MNEKIKINSINTVYSTFVYLWYLMLAKVFFSVARTETLI